MTAAVIPLRAFRLARLLRERGFDGLAADMLASVVENAQTPQARLKTLRDNDVNGLIAASLLVQSGYIVREPCEECGVECKPRTAWVWRSAQSNVLHRYCGRACGTRALNRKDVG